MTYSSVYRVLLAAHAEEELAQLRPYDRKRVLAAMQAQLVSEPATPARNRKSVEPIPGFEHLQPIWELRIGDHRLYYTPDVAGKTVRVWAVRRKGRKTTGEIL